MLGRNAQSSRGNPTANGAAVGAAPLNITPTVPLVLR